MKRIARLTGLFSILLLCFVAALIVSQQVLQRQTQRLRAEAIAQRESQLDAALELAGLGAPPWSPTQTEALSRTLGARIEEGPAPDTLAPPSASSWSFTRVFGPEEAPRVLTIAFEPPPAARLLESTRRIARVLFTLALGAIVVFACFMLGSVRARDAADDSAELDRDTRRAGFQSLQHLATVSARQGEELEQERSARLRVEEDLHVKQRLLNHALAQKIRLGQDLHDGIIQSLYATGLNLETVRPLVASDPAAAVERLAGATQMLNATIREVRTYIHGLSPDTLRDQTFAEAVTVLTQDLAAGRAVDFALSVDPAIAAALPEATRTDLLQIVREAVSNSLRHGAATQIAIALEQQAGAPCLTIRDNGHGCAGEAEIPQGHGLRNIRARAQAHLGVVEIQSPPGRGTTVACRLPAATPHPP